jgi:hypothetical protein
MSINGSSFTEDIDLVSSSECGSAFTLIFCRKIKFTIQFVEMLFQNGLVRGLFNKPPSISVYVVSMA